MYIDRVKDNADSFNDLYRPQTPIVMNLKILTDPSFVILALCRIHARV